MASTRRTFLQQSTALALVGACKPREAPVTRMPVVFVGHGSPMNSIEDNAWSRGFKALGAELPRPEAILAVSAHWFIEGTCVTGDLHPRTIHDFGGFPRALYEIEYPASGAPDLAERLRGLIGADPRTDWGLDHGTWSVLVHAYPEADIPVIQLSIDRRLPASKHLELARSLAPLREEGVLIFGTGNITHNLRAFFGQWQRGDATTPAWSSGFDAAAVAAAQDRDAKWFAGALDTEQGRYAHPTPDHYLPLVYAFGATDDDDEVAFPIEGFDYGLSMRSVVWG